MRHLRKHIGSGETLVYSAKYHWWYNLKSLWLLNLFNEIAVTDQRVLKKSGILNIKVQSIPFENLEARDLKQTLLGRLLGYGDVILFGTGGHSEDFMSVSKPVAFLKAIEQAKAKKAERK